MIPYSYNMVDMGGIDLAVANGTVVPGIYEKIVEAMNLCGDLILYNWKFAEINIVPSAYTVLQQAHSILINGLIQVTELDQITVIGLPPPLVPVSPLVVTENGIYEAEPPASGFNPVRVAVPGPNIESITIESNGIYSPPAGVDGYSPITVTVPGPNIESITIESNGIYSPPAGVDGYSPITVSVPQVSLFENASVFRWTYNGPTTCWGIMKKLTGDVIGQNGDNANANIVLAGDLITVTFHGTSQAIEVVSNVAIDLKAYTTGRTMGVATMVEYTMAANEQKNFTTDALYGGIYFEASEI